MKKQKRDKGITLIALILTIIVLLILAVVAINAVKGDGIIAHAKNARKDYEDKAKKEEDLLKYYEGILETQEVVPTTDQLQEKYQFDYYSTLAKAIDDVNNETSTPDATKENAIAGIYKDENNIVSVVLLKDTEEANQLTISKDVILNLGGKTLKLTSNNAWLLIKSPNMSTIDGRIGGSKIEKDILEESAESVRFIGVGKDSSAANINILGGEYYNKVNSSKLATTFNINYANTFNIKNCKVYTENRGTSQISSVLIYEINDAYIEKSEFKLYATKTQSTKDIASVQVGKTTNCKIVDTTIDVNSNSGCRGAYGVINFGKTSISNTKIFSDAGESSAGQENGCGISVGIANDGEMEIYSGSVYGTHSGLSNDPDAKLYVYGGTFDGFGHGGIYFAQGPNGEAYVQNATLKSGEYNGKHDSNKFTAKHGGSFYIGGGQNANNSNNKVYMDRCTLTTVGTNTIVLRGTSGETNNQLYISNSTIENGNSGKKIRIDGKNKIFVGRGMNITEDDVWLREDSNKNILTFVEAVEFTNEEYKR